MKDTLAARCGIAKPEIASESNSSTRRASQIQHEFLLSSVACIPRAFVVSSRTEMRPNLSANQPRARERELVVYILIPVTLSLSLSISQGYVENSLSLAWNSRLSASVLREAEAFRERDSFNEDDSTTSSAVLALTQLEFCTPTYRPHSYGKFAVVFPTAAKDDDVAGRSFPELLLVEFVSS